MLRSDVTWAVGQQVSDSPEAYFEAMICKWLSDVFLLECLWSCPRGHMGREGSE